MRPTLAIGAIVLLFALLGCVPSVSTVYSGPVVTGRIMGLSDGEPLSGVNVYYAEEPWRSATTGSDGNFTIMPEKSTKVVMQMPGHSLRRQLLVIENDGYRTGYRLVVSSLLQTREERFDMVEVWMTPESNAPADRTSYSPSFTGLSNALSSNGVLSSCDLTYAKPALTLLEEWRSLKHRDFSEAPERYKFGVLHHAQQVQEDALYVWRAVYQGCYGTGSGAESGDLMLKRKALVDSVLGELKGWP